MDTLCTDRSGALRRARLAALAVGLGLLWASPAGAQESAPAAPAPATEAAAPACTMTPAEVFRESGAGVVQVFSLGIDPFRVAGRVRPAQGSGFALGRDLVLTNFHVVAEARSVAVATDGAFLPARIVGSDPVLDVALLEVPLIGFLAPALELAPAGATEVGQPTYALGYPLGVGKSISAGIVSGLGRTLPSTTTSWLSPFVQTDAPTSAGNSGGPLLDACGRVIGMVTLHIESPEAENVGFAIPAATLAEILPQLEETGKVARAWHGLYGQIVTPQIYMLLGVPIEMWSEGFLVETVEPGSAADRAGIRGGDFPVMLGMQEIILGGDIITEVDGSRVSSREQAIAIVRGLKIGQEVTLKVLRGDEVLEKTVTLEERPVLERDLERFRK